jgi:hypothetical protein
MSTADKKQVLITETPVSDARPILTDAFGPKLNSRIVEKVSSGDPISTTDLDELIAELENAPDDDAMIQECRKRLNEAKDPSVPTNEKERMYRDIHRKFGAYAKSLHRPIEPERPLTDTDRAVKNFLTNRPTAIQWISHEGSMILCSLVSVSENGKTRISMTQLPEGDRLILKQSYEAAGGRDRDVESKSFLASFDEYKNFNIEFHTSSPTFYFTIGNRVASIPPDEASRFGNAGGVNVERKGKDIVIGDRIKLEKNRIQNLVNPTDPTNNGANRGGTPPRPKVSGRNAYEIRQDIIENAIDIIRLSNNAKGTNEITDDVLDIAERLYEFVEHKK